MTIAYKHHFDELCLRINYNSVCFVLETGQVLGFRDLRTPVGPIPEKCSLNFNFDLLPKERSKVFYGQNLTLGNQTIICSGSVNLIDIGGQHVCITFFEPRISNFRDNQLPRLLWKNVECRYLGHSDYVSVENSPNHPIVGFTDAELYDAERIAEYRDSDESVLKKGICFWDLMGKIKVNAFTTLVKLEKIPYYSTDNEILGVLIVYQPVNQMEGAPRAALTDPIAAINQMLINRLLFAANIYIAIQNPDAEQRIESFSDNLSRLGYDVELFSSGKMTMRDIIYPGEYDRYVREVQEHLFEKKETFWLTTRIVDNHHDIIAAKIFFTPLLSDDHQVLKVALLIDCYDVTEEASMNFNKIMVAVNRMHVVFTVRKISNLAKYEIISENFNQFGFHADDIIREKIAFLDVILPEDREKYQNAVQTLVDHKVLQNIVEYRLVNRRNQIYWLKETMFTTLVRGVEYLESAIINVTSTKTAFDRLENLNKTENPKGDPLPPLSETFNFTSVLKSADVKDILDKYALATGTDVALFNNYGALMTESTGKREAMEFVMKQLEDFSSFSLSENLHCLYDNLFVQDFPVTKADHRIGTMVCYALISDFPSRPGNRCFNDPGRMFHPIKSGLIPEINRYGRLIAENLASVVYASAMTLMQIQSSSTFASDLTRQKVGHEIILDLLNIASTTEDLEHSFHLMMPRIGQAMQLSRISLFRHDEAEDVFDLDYEWYVETEVPRKNFFQKLKKDESFFLGWDVENHPSFVVNTSDVLEDPRHLREFAHAVVGVRLFNKGRKFGFLSFVDNFSSRRWTADEIIMFEDVGYILSSVIDRSVSKDAISHNFREYIRSMESIPSAIALVERDTLVCQVANQKFWEIVSGLSGPKGHDFAAFGVCIRKIMAALEANTIDKEIHFADSDKWFLISRSDVSFETGVDSFLVILTDITPNKKTQETISSLAFSDVLTGLPNRLKFEIDLKKIYESDPAVYSHNLIFILNIDNFKMINNTFSYAVGDELLKLVAKQLKAIPEINGQIYRFGGDEFGILIHQQRQLQIYDFANKVMRLFEKPFFIDGYETTCTVSMGIVFLSDADRDVNDLIRKANLSLKDAKLSGKNRFVLYDASLKKYEEDTGSLERALKIAVDNGCEEFQLFFQPIVSAKTGKIISCEALVRWFSKEFGLVSPVKFIPIAEMTGLIVPLGKFILNQACKEAKKWLDYGLDIKFSVNFSVIQTLQSDLVETITKSLRTYRVPTKNLIFEVTESLAINDINKVIEILTAVRETGVQIAMDDFGTGYSSLNHLRRLPLDIVKIDRSFIFNIEYDPYTVSFVDTITKFCHIKHTDVCCEGVESEIQKKVLIDVGVDTLQGYLFGKPVPPEEFWKLILNNK